MSLEEKLTRIAETEGPDAAWRSMSMGGGRKLEPTIINGKNVGGTIYDGCPNSPDGYHHYTAISCVQSVEEFVCDYCSDRWFD